MVYINDLVQEFWRTSSDEAIGAPFFAMRRLFEILQEYLETCNTMCFLIVSVFVTPVDLADKNLQLPNSWHHSTQWDLDKFKILLDRYRKMFDRSLSKSKDLGDLLRFLPGVVVQHYINIQGMAALYLIY